ncbi:unnamed protein product [Boreogadus saida]
MDATRKAVVAVALAEDQALQDKPNGSKTRSKDSQESTLEPLVASVKGLPLGPSGASLEPLWSLPLGPPGAFI